MGSVGARELTVLGEFKPFGLIAEALDGKPSDTCVADYRYFLFSPQVTKQRDEADELDLPSPSSDWSDHELFIRGNRIIWSIGLRVYKRFTLPSAVIKACWCQMGDTSDTVLCILQCDSLSIYDTSGEVTSVPLPRSITSIWALPYGLLLQQAPEGSSQAHIQFSSLSPLLSARDTIRSKREVSTQQNCTAVLGLDFTLKGDGSSMSSHLILKDPLEEPQPTYIEERGRLNLNKEFDERTIWTGDCVPLMASYNKAKLQHSLWVVETINSNIEMGNSRLPGVPLGVLTKQFSFRRIWQGKGAQEAATKVFLATADDASPIICFLLQEQNKLLSLQLHTVEKNTKVIYDIKPDMSWSIPAVAAAPVVVTRPGVKVCGLPFVDIVVLTSKNTLLLYCGKQCLCRFKLSHLGKDQVLHDPKIVGLADAVEERINVIVNSGRIYRCTWRRNPSSSLANDCITAMAEGLNSMLYNHFLVLLWLNGDQTYLNGTDMTADSEWETFQSVITRIFKESDHTSEKLSDSVSCSSWEFLINSRYHKQYNKSYPITGFSEISIDRQGLYSPVSSMGTSETAGNSLYTELVAETLDTLHTVYESLKLDNLRKRDLGLLVVLLCDIAAFLREDCYLDHYIRDFPCLSKGHEVSLTSSSKRIPPSLFRWLESCLKHGCSSASISHLPSLIFRDGSSVVNWGRKIVSFYSLLCGAELLGKRLSSGVSCAVASGSYNTPEELTVLSMVGERVGLQQLDLLPAGVSLPLRDALDKCRDSPPMDWPAAAYVLLGREDLAFSCLAYSRKSVELESHLSVNMTCMSTPYMLNLHPVTILSSISDTIQSGDNKLEDVDSVAGYVADGMEHIFNSGIQLRYGRDLRLNEVRRLLCSARPVVIQTPVNPTASDQDLQQAQLWQLAQRTTALPFGRGAFTLSTTCTLLTEALTVPKLILAGRLPSQQNATVNLDPNVRNIQELKSWPEFHNAVAAGLRLAPPQGKMSRTWILYNKPEEPTVVHAGLLLALGLRGHLRVLTITDIYQYYSQEHESTTVGLMLGLAASYRGTMQPAISKSLYVHIPSRHPSSFPELELPTLLQSAALLSVGILYEGSAHPQTMQILLGEIGRRSGGDNVLEREGYAVAAGFSLGLVSLGRGEDAPGSVDALVDRLFQYIGSKEPQNERFHFFVPSIDELNQSAGQIMDGTAINVDVTAPGATIAIALMFLKTESKLVHSRLSVPQTHFDLHYVRPDFIMLRVIARNLIMWSRVHASEEWIQSQIPEVIQNGVKGLGDTMSDPDEINVDAFVQAYVHIVVGACISLGLRYAGSRDGNLQELLYRYALYFLNEIKPGSVSSGAFPKGLSRYIDRGSLETCLHLIVLSLCVVMAGSGHLQTFKLLKYLRGRNSADGHLSFGNQMAVSLAIGFLFIGGGMQTFSTSKSSIAALLITLYPRLPTGPNDNRCHLQAFRHLYVLATEARCVQTVDVDSGLPVYCPLEVTVRETEQYAETSFYEVAPCILPERAVFKAVRVCGPRYWSQVINHIPEEKPWSSGEKGDVLRSGILYVKRKVGACSYVDDPAGCQSLLSRAMHKVFGLTRLRASAASRNCQDGDLVDQLISTFSSNPSLISFAQLCCDPNWNSRSDIDFPEFCLQVLFECVSKDRPALLQVYLSLYTTIGSMVDRVTSSSSNLQDTLFISSLKIALAYNNGLLSKRSTSSKEGIVQSTFLGSVKKWVEKILSSSLEFQDFSTYIKSGRWPTEDCGRRASTLLSWYVQWYNVPSPFEVKRAFDKINAVITPSSVPLLHLVFPRTDVTALCEINRVAFCSRG
ncbi:anaphase-promoting complex subunit 1 isoform X1 [Capsicum annuum]|uniref:anaphase-promoting complex subunit 1 isoform X1 n=2 Tax=Capsicum annuum TaxID=4072 RepID=UPI0007BF3418|nr:anaphase-promoting complex subunit 1 isoform X1 [Capsicum annuum]